jgi:hypothetical protein
VRWLRRIRGALGMGLTWAFGWALVGVLIGVAWTLGVPMEWFIDVFDAPLPALWVPGFFAGTTFSVVLGIAGRRRRFDELSLPWFSAWGALGGLLLGLVPVLGSGMGIMNPTAAVALGTLTVLGGASACGTLTVARMSEDRELLDAGEEVEEVGLSEDEARELLGGGG